MRGPDKSQNMLYDPPSPTLADVINAISPPAISSFATVVVMISMWGRCVSHLYAGPVSRPENDFWTRHYELDATIIKVFNTCSDRFAYEGLPENDPHNLFIKLLFHTVIIYLHQAAVAYAESSGLPLGATAESVLRCQTAAIEIAALIRASSGLEAIGGVRGLALSFEA